MVMSDSAPPLRVVPETTTGAPEEDVFSRAARRRRAPTSGLVNLGKKVLTHIPPRKPAPGWHVRTSPDPNMSAVETLFHMKSIDDNYYYIDDKMIELLQGLNPKGVVDLSLTLAVTKLDVPFLWVNGMEDEEGKLNSWHASTRDVIEVARDTWISVRSEMQSSGYTYRPDDDQSKEPLWPDLTWAQILRLAFRNYIIRDENHPIVRSLRG
jgi:hypothetical protein